MIFPTICGYLSIFMVGSSIGNLTLGPSFGYNLCFKCPNGSWEPISDIYILRPFQWYNKLFNPMNFDLFNHPLKIRKSTRIQTLKVKVHLGVLGFIPSHFFKLPRAWNVTHGLHSWLTPLQTIALVVSPRLGLQHLA
jgi:hypothetical protein